MTTTNTPHPRHHYSSLLKTLTFAFLAMVGFSTMAQAESDHFDSIVWAKIDTPNNVSNPLSIAVSPETHDFVALGSDNEGDTTGAYYFLDHNNLTAGWQKRGSFEALSYPDRVLYGVGRFIVTFTKTVVTCDESKPQPSFYPRILTSTDNGSSWTQTKEYLGNLHGQEITRIYVHNGSGINHETDDNDYFFGLKEPSGETRFVKVGGLAFTSQEIYYSKQDLAGNPLPRGPYEIVVFAGDDENGWIGLGKDGTSYVGLTQRKSLKTKPIIAPVNH